MRNRAGFTTFTLLAFVLLAHRPSLSPTPASPLNGPAKQHNEKTKSTVYVCACLQTKSCACMTEAKTEGPCACGTEGGPPMKAVAPNSDWAKQNRDALAK